MALTGALAALVQKLYAKQLYKEMRDMLFWRKFMGEKETDIIQTKNEFTKQKGDQITVGLGMDLAGTGVIGDNELEGNEEALTVYSDAITIDQIRNAVRVQGRMEEQKASYSIRETAKERLKFWLQETIDQKMFNHLCGDTSETFPATALAPDSGTLGHTIWGGNATSDATIDAADILDVAGLRRAKLRAKSTSPKVKPYKMENGEEFYVVVVHDRQAYDLKGDSAWQNAHYYAHDRGLKNPIFTGALGIIDGMVLHVHPKIYTTATWGAGSNVEGARAIMLGQQAGLFAVAGEPTWVEKDFDYSNQTGVATGMIFGVKKLRFNSLDFGVIAIDTAAASNPS